MSPHVSSILHTHDYLHVCNHPSTVCPNITSLRLWLSGTGRDSQLESESLRSLRRALRLHPQNKRGQAEGVDEVQTPHSLSAPRHRGLGEPGEGGALATEAEAQIGAPEVRTRIRTRTPAVGHVTPGPCSRSRKWPEAQGGRRSPLAVARRRPGEVSGAGGGGEAEGAWGTGCRAGHGPHGALPPPVGNWDAESGRGRGGQPEEHSGTPGRALPDSGWADTASRVSGACEAGQNGRAGPSAASGLLVLRPAV